MGLQLKLIYQRVCKIFIGKENKPDLDGKIQYFSVQRTVDQLVSNKIQINKDNQKINHKINLRMPATVKDIMKLTNLEQISFSF